MDKQDNQPAKFKGITPVPVHQRLPKRWVIASQKYRGTNFQRDNERVEGHFNSILLKTKQLLKKQEQTLFERDYRNDNSENAFTMHTFMSDTVYLSLECRYDYRYHIEYAFNNCVHECKIRLLLDVYLLQGRVNEITLKPTYAQFYQTVITIQDSRHITLM